MGFMDALKAGNNRWGWATGDFFEGVAALAPQNLLNNKDHKLMLSAVGIETVIFGKEDVASVEVVFATSEWIKYRIALKDGKKFYATICAMEQTNKGRDISMALMNFEWWLSGLLYN